MSISEAVILPLELCGRYWRSDHEREIPLIDEYAECLIAGDEFPPIEVRETRPNHFSVDDGYHRLHAHWLAGFSTIKAVIKEVS